MGQLKNGILALQKTCINMEPQIDELASQQDELSERVYAAAKRIEEGLNALVLYMIAKLKKAGRTLEADGAKPLKGEMDPTIATFGKGIVQAKTDVKAIIAKLKEQHKASVGKLTASIKESSNSAAALKGVADKKKAKWLKSAKYKAKIGGYLAALAAIDDILKKQTDAIKGIESINQDDAWVERCYKFNQDMTLKQVRDLASSDLNSNIKDFTAKSESMGVRARKLRDEHKGLGGQFSVMKKWVDEADDMETESEEK